MKNFAFALLIIIISIFVSSAYADVNGPHGDPRIRSPKGICATCHIPHEAKGRKIWAISGKNNRDLYKGIRQLCQTCHDGTLFYSGSPPGSDVSDPGYETADYPPASSYSGEFGVETQGEEKLNIYASTGIYDVFGDMSAYESHVMHGAVELDPKKSQVLLDDIASVIPDVFPLDPTDEDIYPEGAPEKYRSGAPGFYCGTCHDPHKQPDGKYTGGFYLRTRKGHDVGSPWVNRKPFCVQCHGVIHAPESDCLACHHPHLGKTMIKDDEKAGRWILRNPIVQQNFSAKPNVLQINDGDGQTPSALCYGCHIGEKDNGWIEAGAVPIFGDGISNPIYTNDIGDSGKRQHHPMGNQACLDDPSKAPNGVFIRAPGLNDLRGSIPDILNKNNEITCTSCHDGIHGSGPYKDQPGAKEKSKKNNFLRWDFENDNPGFCTQCHSNMDKKDAFSAQNLDHDIKHHQTKDEAFARNVTRRTFVYDPNSGIQEIETGCGNCMFCHFIHDGEDRGETATPSLEALMRVPPVNLPWSGNDSAEDYEDLCFGCHNGEYKGKKNIVGDPETGSWLKPGLYFSHTFTGEPNISIDPNIFPVSDGDAIDVFDDYGVLERNIYCGTCHDVHSGKNWPYLRSSKSPYEAYGFCESCHDQDDFVMRSHPVDRGPNDDKSKGSMTKAAFDPVFSQGGSGRPGGILSEGKVICLTCHNTHSAVTSNEETAHGTLLVMDNFPADSPNTNGDEICMGCHDQEIFKVNGPHIDELSEKNYKGICHNCHTPHYAKTGSKIWALELKGEFGGVHELCYSCHNTSASSGIDSVFLKNRYENHVMFGGAAIIAGNCPYAPNLEKDVDTSFFPLDPNDYDTIPDKDVTYCSRSSLKYLDSRNNEGAGFYCGSCHNPHLQPDDPNSNGDYLRSRDQDSIGTPGNRKDFCKQCHGVYHFPSSDCLYCHHPHKGRTLIEENEYAGRKIISLFPLKDMIPEDFYFSALPNVPKITEDPNDPDPIPSRYCYFCHNFQMEQIAERPIPVIYGDDAGALGKEHHPMGAQASQNDPNKFISGDFIRAKGMTKSIYSSAKPILNLNKKGEITCTTCHDDLHGPGFFEDQPDSASKSEANKFLRWELNNIDGEDKPNFCIACHDDKNVFNLSEGKHLISKGEHPDERLKRGGCMFCHFIHDGEERQQEDPTAGIAIRPDVDALLRIGPVNLSWGDRTGNESIYDYEDLCFGCHSSQSIVKYKPLEHGSLLDPNHFTHPFAISSRQDIIGVGFPISDGQGTAVLDDYGTQAGQMYCGTCHDIHDNSTAPYIGSHSSPYQPNGLCEECHDKGGQFVSSSHPIGVGPNPDPSQGGRTASEFVDTYNGKGYLFSQGGSGRPGGVTYPFNTQQEKSTDGGKGKVICLTCHNVHAAATSWQGTTKTDTENQNHGKLLVKDNNAYRPLLAPGSELCKACHPFGAEQYGFPSGKHGGSFTWEQSGICSACHTPHYSKGPKLWSLPGYNAGPFKGIRQLCFICHNPDLVIATAGTKTVFKEANLGGRIPDDYYEDHVTRNWANIGNIEFYDPNVFPLDPNDHDVIPTKNQVEPDPHDGFYCGSCHNVHIQQGFDYLRSKDGNTGLPSYRKNFCIECHIDAHNQDTSDDCLKCHHPHMGATRIDDDPNGRWITKVPLARARDFMALPNVDGFTSPDVSSTCYSCHAPYLQDPNTLGWNDLGATTIYGDFIDTNSDSQARAKAFGWTPREHHPMGRQARFGQSLRAPGADRSVFNIHGELTCTSCHYENHKGERENNFLRWDFANDNSHFCMRCHTNKQEINFGPPGWGHHQTRESSPLERYVNERFEIDGEGIYKDTKVKCGNCMFCHFIHDGNDQGDASKPSIDSLMRVPPVNLMWADSWQDEDTLDYEDLCYGCHSQQDIVGGVGGFGSLIISTKGLSPDAASDPILGRRFSHRFRSAPNPSSATMIRFSSGGPFPLSDGKGENILDDYGAASGNMYCGTCHDVHSWAANPGTKYLRGLTSPYMPGGFCHECHSAEPAPSVCSPALNHRLAPAPEGLVSVVEWSPLLYSNVDPAMSRGKGEKGGFVAVPAGLTPNLGQMTCMTCHNIHAAETTYDGHVDQPHSDETAIVDGRRGKLLIIDNGHGPSGSDLCLNCHPDHSQIIGSQHDFTHRGLDGLGAGIADKGVCSACHRPHIALDEKLLWARPMVEEKVMFGSVPGFALGSTIYCYDCHSGPWCDINPLPELFLPFPPQDVAFIDGPGGIIAGYYEYLPAFVQDIPPHRIPAGMPTEVKTSGHYIRQPIITPGIAQNDKLACNDCHNPHRGITKEGIPNQAFIKSVLGGKPMGPYKASMNMTYHKEIRNNLESRQACVACHGLADRPNAPVYPPAAFVQVNPLYTSILPVARPTSTVYDHFDAGLYPCTDCHKHNRAMVLCIDCHSYPPVTTGNGWSGTGDTDQNYTGGAGAHYKHVLEHQFPCTMCHLGCLHDPGGATVVNPVFIRAKVSIDFDATYKFPRTAGEYQTKMGYYGPDGKPTIPPLYDPVNQTCYVGCHNPLVGDPDETPNLDNPSPSWSLQVPQAPTPPNFPGSGFESWITVRMPYLVPTGIPGQWIIPWPGM
ncbi:hypothetical protein JXL19_07975 [bacterium]|nr:hypothetical protein [bacterium]